MQSKKSAEWILAAVTAFSMGYATYKYFMYDRRTPEQLKEEGNSLYAQMKFEEAIEKYTEALKLVDEMPNLTAPAAIAVKLLNNTSQAHFALKHYSEALKYSEHVLDLNPLHLNTFKRLVLMEKKGHGYGDLKGLAVISAYLILEQKIGIAECKNLSDKKKLEKEVEKWTAILEAKMAEKVSAMIKTIPPVNPFHVSFVKLEEVVSIFRDTLNSSIFNEADTITSIDKKLLSFIDERNYSEMVQLLEEEDKTNTLTKRGFFLVGNIMYIQEKYTEAVAYLDKSRTTHGDMLSIYIQKLKNMSTDISEEKIIRISRESNDPIIKAYMNQIHLTTNNLGQYFANMVELENEKNISLPFISNAKSQLIMKEHKEAIATLHRGLCVFPEEINLMCAGVEILMQIPDDSEAQKMLLKLLSALSQDKFKTSPRCMFFRYIGYTILGNPDEIQCALHKAMQLDPYNQSLLMEQGLALINKGNIEGLDFFQKAASVAPNTAEEPLLIMLTYQKLFSLQAMFPEVSKLMLTETQK
ncbi:hypothetical protein NECID01_1249 [Nematocida sp. AWRm77]|nr:hypothetical protein NECID01_1249 [Nematocida sp. AWRm77]